MVLRQTRAGFRQSRFLTGKPTSRSDAIVRNTNGKKPLLKVIDPKQAKIFESTLNPQEKLILAKLSKMLKTPITTPLEDIFAKVRQDLKKEGVIIPPYATEMLIRKARTKGVIVNK